jgi:hypothetical protein
VDLGKFMTMLCFFLVGFSMLITAMNTPFYDLLPEVNSTKLIKNKSINLYLQGEEDPDDYSNCPPTTLTSTEFTGRKS